MRQNIFHTVLIILLTFLLYPYFCAVGNIQSGQQEREEKKFLQDRNIKIGMGSVCNRRISELKVIYT